MKGRKKHEGRRRVYIVSDEAHHWIIANGGGQYLTNVMRVVAALVQKGGTDA